MDDRKLLHDTENTGYSSTLMQGGGLQAFKGLLPAYVIGVRPGGAMEYMR